MGQPPWKKKRREKREGERERGVEGDKNGETKKEKRGREIERTSNVIGHMNKLKEKKKSTKETKTKNEE